MCKEDRCLEPLSVENKRPGLWVKDHIWPLDSVKCVCVRVCPCVLLSLEEMEEPITVLLNTVPLCDPPPSNLHMGSSVDHLGPEPVIFPCRGSGFEAPCPRLWSIRPLLNEKAVKGHKAGVHVRACVCSGSPEVFCQFPENVQSLKADHVLLSFTAHSVVDKTLKHSCRPITVQEWAVIRAARRIHQTLNSEVMSNNWWNGIEC